MTHCGRVIELGDFIYLALKEIKVNSPRLTAGVIAVALASFSLVVYRGALAGYPVAYAKEIRALSGGELLVFRGLSVLVPGSGPELEWRPWTGQSWQSYLDYFFPRLPEHGYLAPSSVPPWSPLDLKEIHDRVAGVPGVVAVVPYRAVPCVVRAGGREFPAILRARAPESEQGIHSLEQYLVEGRMWKSGAAEAIIPSSWEDSPAAVRIGDSISVILSPPDSTEGSDREYLSEFRLVVAGKYDMAGRDTVVVPDGVPVSGDSTARAEEPSGFEWTRPEIFVEEPLFQAMCSEAGWEDVPCYQAAIRLAGMRDLERVRDAVQELLGQDYTVLCVTELGQMRAAGAPQPVSMADTRFLILLLTYLFSGTVVCGTVYIILVQSRRKIGLLKVIGATSKQIALYCYSLILWVFLGGSSIGYAAGEGVRLLQWAGMGLPFSSWIEGALGDAALIVAAAVAVSAVTGCSVVAVVSRLSCAEVLNRGQV